MASFFLAPDPLQSTFFIPGGAVPGNGAQLFIYVAGSTTKQTVAKDNAGAASWTNPIVLDSGGNLPNGGVIWIPSGVTIKAVYAPSNDTDPPASPYRTIDNIAGINDTTASQSEWVTGPAPTFVGATSFTLVGDQTGTFKVGRRIKTANTGGTVYSIITNSAFAAVTTVTVANDSGNLDSGLSAVSYALLDAVNQSSPPNTDVYPVAQNNTDRTKRLSLNLAPLNTSTNVVGTPPPINFYFGLPKGHLTGFTMSTAASISSTMTVSTGAARDTNNSTDIYINTPLSKNASAWAVGNNNGGLLDGGGISSNAWYHFYGIQRIDTGVNDIGFSSTQVSPPLPAGYSFSRRIGSAKTNTSSLWTGFTQDGDLFQWSTLVSDIASGNPGTAAVTRTLGGVPTGVNVEAILQIYVVNVGVGTPSASYTSDLSVSDQAAGGTLTDTPAALAAAGGVTPAATVKRVRTNTSAQVRSRISFSDANVSYNINTLGWVDTRGKNS